MTVRLLVICDCKIADYSLALVHRVWSFCRVSVDEGLLPVLSAKLLGSVKLIAAGFLSSVTFTRQMVGCTE